MSIEIKVLGPGCAKCAKQYDEATKAVATSGVDAVVVKVERIDEIIEHGVMMTPALIVDGAVKISGRIAYAADIATWLTTAAARRDGLPS